MAWEKSGMVRKRPPVVDFTATSTQCKYWNGLADIPLSLMCMDWGNRVLPLLPVTKRGWLNFIMLATFNQFLQRISDG
jgi:hypothetical protein